MISDADIGFYVSFSTDFLYSLIRKVYHWSNNSGDFTLMGTQMIAVLFIFGWTFTVMGTYFFVLNSLGWLRIDPLEEEVGMDISRHKGSCYDMSGASQQDVAKLENMRQLVLEDRSNTSRGSKGKKTVPPTVEKEDQQQEA